MKKAALREVEWTDLRFRKPAQEPIVVTATMVRTEFGRILDLVAEDRMVVITRYNTPCAVLIPVDTFDSSGEADAVMLDTLTAEFDALLDGMQTPEARAAADRAFYASAEELSRAAVEAAQQPPR